MIHFRWFNSLIKYNMKKLSDNNKVWRWLAVISVYVRLWVNLQRFSDCARLSGLGMEGRSFNGFCFFEFWGELFVYCTSLVGCCVSRCTKCWFSREIVIFWILVWKVLFTAFDATRFVRTIQFRMNVSQVVVTLKKGWVGIVNCVILLCFSNQNGKMQ